MLRVLSRFRRAFDLHNLRQWPWFSIVVLGGVLVVALLAPWLAPQPPTVGNLREVLEPPTWAGGTTGHFLGTDRLGRDILSRIIYGARISLLVAVMGGAVAGAFGIAMGVISGYFGGLTDAIIQRATEVSFSLPSILLALVMALALGPGIWNIIFVVTIIYWGRYCRQARAEVLSIKEREYVALAKVAGASPVYIMLRHVLPNILNTQVILTSLIMGHLILLEATLSFLGVGVPPPTPSWGSMVADGRNLMVQAWWITLCPGLAIFIVVLAANLLGDRLRDRLDPRLRRVL